MNERLEELRAELQKGRQRLELLDRERQELRDTMLRISGSIQVLEELRGQTVLSVPQTELAPINACPLTYPKTRPNSPWAAGPGRIMSQGKFLTCGACN